MPIDPTKVAIAVDSGVALVCAMCEHFWNAQDRGSGDCGQVCGGPMSGGTFDKYKGPITDFSAVCFVCGDTATHAVRATGSVRVLGCCKEHVDTVKSWKPVEREAVNISILSPSGEKTTDEMSVPPTRVKLRVL